jgi:DTW domain-containing protein YfiP
MRPMNPPDQVPHVELPCELHIVKHPQEHNSKSTGVHAPILSAARLIDYAPEAELPPYDPASTVLLFPSESAACVHDMTLAQLQAVRTCIIVDCTWAQASGILSDERLRSLPHVSIEAEKTLFWRFQKGKTANHLATIEAMYFFCRQYHQALHAAGAPGLPPYSDQYDDLFYYYSYQYETVQRVYRERFSAAAAAGSGGADATAAPGSQRPIDSAEAKSLAGVPVARLPAALSLLRRHRMVDRGTGDEIRTESTATVAAAAVAREPSTTEQ